MSADNRYDQAALERVVALESALAEALARAEAAERERDELRARCAELDSQLAAAWVDDSDDDGGWTGG